MSSIRKGKEAVSCFREGDTASFSSLSARQADLVVEGTGLNLVSVMEGARLNFICVMQSARLNLVCVMKRTGMNLYGCSGAALCCMGVAQVRVVSGTDYMIDHNCNN